jgi:hypothetical protein
MSEFMGPVSDGAMPPQGADRQKENELLADSSAIRGRAAEYLKLASEIRGMFEPADWESNTKDAGYKEECGAKLGEALRGYMLLMSSSTDLQHTGNSELIAIGTEFQKAITEDKELGSKVGEMQGDIVFLNGVNVVGEGLKFDQRRLEGIQDFLDTTVLLATELQEKIVEFEQNTISPKGQA